MSEMAALAREVGVSRRELREVVSRLIAAHVAARPTSAPEASPWCLGCGQEIPAERLSGTNGKLVRYCSTQCRRRHGWRREDKHKKVDVTCPGCGETRQASLAVVRRSRTGGMCPACACEVGFLRRGEGRQKEGAASPEALALRSKRGPVLRDAGAGGTARVPSATGGAHDIHNRTEEAA